MFYERTIGDCDNLGTEMTIILVLNESMNVK